MSREEVEKRRKWQWKIYKTLKQISKPLEMYVLDKKFTVLPKTFAPLWCDSFILARNVLKEVKKGDVVLDLGTGVGVQGIFAAKKAKKVISTDVNPYAVTCATLNVQKHHVTNKVQVLKSDLFSHIHEKFDLIIFNPPFRWFKPKSMLEKGETDEGYKTLHSFFKEVRNYLKLKGRMLVVFSESGDIRHFEKLVNRSNFQSEVLDEETLNGWKYIVYRIK